MPTVRTNEMICTLCQINKATATGSHFAPASLIETTVGKRDNEEAYSFDVNDNEIEVFYGRANLKNTDPEIKKNPHVSDYVFCTECEKKLGVIESEVAAFIKSKIYDEKYKDQFKVEVKNDEFELRTTNQFPPSIFHTFIYSVVWRVCLQQRLSLNQNSIGANVEERMRYFLVAQLVKTVAQLKSDDINLPYPYALLTAKDVTINEATTVNPDEELTNPSLFYLGKFMALFHFGSDLPYKKLSKKIPEALNRVEFANENTKTIKIILIVDSIWKNVNKAFLEQQYIEWRNEAIAKISSQKNITRQEAFVLLKNEILEVVENCGMDFALAGKFALNSILRRK